jgi:hypothetical protein
MIDLSFRNSGRKSANPNYKLPDTNIIGGGSIYRHLRNMKLTYSKSFGNKKLSKVVIKSGSEEEQSRVGN